MCNHTGAIDCQYPTVFCKGCNEIEYCIHCSLKAHPAKKCEEVKKEGNLARDPRQVAEEAMAEVVIRRCPKCDSRFVKEDGCNQMTCATPGCNTKSCYLCKEQIPGYDHFCKNMDRKTPSQPCPDSGCDKRCNLWTAKDVMEEIEKAWKLEAGRSALQEHGVSDAKNIEAMLSSLLVS